MSFLVVLPFLDQKYSATSTIYLLLPYWHVPSDHSVLTVQVKNGTFCVGPVFAMDKIQAMLQEEVCIIRFLPLHELATRAITTWEVTTLACKPQSSSVKAATFTTKPSLSRDQNANILLSLERCLQIAWKGCGWRSHPWLWCQRTGWVDLGWVLTLVAPAQPHLYCFWRLKCS